MLTVLKALITFVLGLISLVCLLFVAIELWPTPHAHRDPNALRFVLELGATTFFSILCIRWLWKRSPVPRPVSEGQTNQPTRLAEIDIPRPEIPAVTAQSVAGDSKDAQFRRWLVSNGYTNQDLPPGRMQQLRDEFERS